MSATIFSFLMAILWCDFFVILLCILLRRKGFIENFTIWPFVLMISLSLLRLLGAVEFPFVHILRSEHVFPAIVKYMEFVVFRYVRVFDILLYLWLLVSIILFIRFLIREKSFLKHGKNISKEAKKDVLEVLSAVSKGKSKKVSVVIHPELSVPMIAGVFRPVIYLPEYPLSGTQLYYILLHEWTHYRQKDVWIKLFSQLLCIAFWWNPVQYLLRAAIDRVMEMKSDLSIAGHLSETQKTEYLDTILFVTKKCKSQKKRAFSTGMALVSGGEGEFLKRRFRAVLEYKRAKKVHRFASVFVMIGMLLCFLVSYMFVLQPFAGPPEETKTALYFFIDEDNAYLVKDRNDAYALYVDDKYVCNISERTVEPFVTLEVREEEGDDETK